MRKVLDIYKEYKIMPSLQMHMLRVAAVANIICDNFTEEVHTKDIVTACLFHDMGNIIKSELELFPEFTEPEGIEYWKSVKKEYIDKYGTNEDKATIQIMKEVNLPHDIVDAVENISFSLLCKNSNENNLIYKIVNYADSRVAPHGVVSYDERMDEGKKRYEHRKEYQIAGQNRDTLVACGKEIEKQIFGKCKIKPEGINDDSIKSYVEKLKDFEI